MKVKRGESGLSFVKLKTVTLFVLNRFLKAFIEFSSCFGRGSKKKNKKNLEHRKGCRFGGEDAVFSTASRKQEVMGGRDRSQGLYMNHTTARAWPKFAYNAKVIVFHSEVSTACQ